MGINRYTKPIDYSLQKTQILPRTEIIAGALQQRQAMYDEGVSKLQEAYGAISNYKVVGDAAKKDLEIVEAMMEEGATNLLNKDLADPAVKSEVNKLIGGIANNEKLKTHLLAADTYKQYSEQIDDLRKKGKLTPSNYFKYQQEWDKYKSTGQFNSDILSNPIVEEAVDVLPERQKLFAHLKASGGDSIGFLEDIAYKTGYKGIGNKDIENAVMGQINAYMMGSAGRQERRDYEYLVASGGIDPKKSFQSYLVEGLLGVGSTYKYSDSSTNIDGAYNIRRKERKEKEEEYVGDGYMPAMNKGNKIELDSDGNINIPAYLDVADWFTGGDSRTPAQKQLQTRIKDIAKSTGKSLDEVVTSMNRDPNIRVAYYNSKKAKEVSSTLFDPKTGGGRFWTTSLKNDKYPNGISMEELMKEQGISETEAKGGFTVIGDVYPDNPYTPKGMAVMVNGEKFIIDNSANIDKNKQEDKDRLYNFAANQSKYNGTGTHTEILGGVEFTWKWDPIKNEVTKVKEKIVKNN
jgi:hypothetical protein